MSAIDAVLSRRDVVVYDSESHACIVDGVRLHLGKRFTFDHNDMESLEKNLQRATRVAEESDGGVLVITEGVFGMKGDQGKLREIAELKSKYSFRLMVDDAHGFGTLGATGAGTGEEQGVQDAIDLYLSTFAKSMASIGAFIAGEPDIIRFLKYNLRSQIFAKTLPMPLVIGARKRLELIRKHPEYLQHLWNNVRMLQTGLKERGLEIGETNTCVTPVYLRGQAEEAAGLVHDLRETYGIFCSVVVYPVVPRGTILLRLIPTSQHTTEDIQFTLDAFGAISGKLKEGRYRVSRITNPIMEV
jgi:glycine C-acetyltransferase